MTSFISSFKPLLLALLIVAAIEVLVRAIPISQDHNSELLALAPQQNERITGIFLNEKLVALGSIPARYIQVGDSSGFYGINPAEIDLAGTWLNFGCCARAGFNGYRTYTDEILRRQRAAGAAPEYLVLAMTPYFPPIAEFEAGEDAKLLSAAFGPWARPTSWLTGLRLPLTNMLYRGQPVDTFLDSRTDSYWGRDFSDFSDDLEALPQTRGWMVRPGETGGVVTDACDFPVEYADIPPFSTASPHSLLRRELDRMAVYAQDRDVKLIVVVNPVPCDLTSESAQTLQREFDAFRVAHPEVEVPFPSFRRFPEALFKDRYHLNEEGARLNSQEIAAALR
jgi:hypothetical protein